MADVAQGAQEEQYYRQMGAGDDQIDQWKQDQVKQFREAGANDQQINDYFGVKDPDTSNLKQYVQNNLAEYKDSKKDENGKLPPHEATTFGEALEAAWQGSVFGTFKRHGAPVDVLPPEHQGFLMRMTEKFAQYGLDAPVMMLGAAGGAIMGGAGGALAGGAAGSVIPGVGTLGGIGGGFRAGVKLGAGYGAFAAPAALRQLLIEHYQDPNGFRDPMELMAHLGSIAWKATKEGIPGSVAAATGGLSAPVLGTTGALGAEYLGMVGAQSAIAGHLPTWNEFQDGAIMMGALHTAMVAPKLMNIYANTGERPADIAEEAQTNPVLKQQLVSENPNEPAQAAPKTKETLDNVIPFKKPETPEGGEPPDQEKQYQGDVDKVISRLAVKEAPTPQAFMSMLKEKMDKFYEDQVNAVEPLNEARKVTGKEAGGLDDPFQQALMAPGWRGKMQAAFEGKEGLNSVFEPVKEDMREFLAYSMSKRALERDTAGPNNEGKETGINLESAANVVKQVEEGAGFADKSGKFKEAQMRWVNFQNKMLNYAREHQLISTESQKNIMTGSEEHIPMTREQDLDPYLGKTPDALGQIAQHMKGSEKKINDPILQTYLNTARIFHAAAKNDVGLALGDLIDNGENGFAIGEKIEKPTGADNEVTFKRDGEDQTYRLMPNYARAVKSLNYDAPMTNSIVKIATAIGSTLRKGTTLVPDFITRHFIRQTATGSVYSQANPLTFMYHTMLGTWDAIVKNDNFYKFLDSGASAGEISNVNKYFEKQGFWSTNQEAGNFVDKTWNVVTSPFHALEWAAYRADVGQRIAEFKIRGGMNESASPEDVFKAGSAAREVTLDYDRHGAQTKVWRALTPFMNIGIQGSDKLMRGFANDPFMKALTGVATLGNKGDLSFENAKQIPFGMSAQAAMAITLPTLVNWALNHKDSRYQDAPQWEKDLYWLIPWDKWEKAQSPEDAMSRPDDLRKQLSDGTWMVNNGTTMKISKPFELGVIFGSLPERLMSKYFDQNPHELKDFTETLIHGVMPNIIPTAALPAIETMTNQNLFMHRPIIPDHLKNVAPEMQYTPYTSQAAKTLGKWLGYVPGLHGTEITSPLIVDNWIREWSGTGGQYALSIANAVQNKISMDRVTGARPAMEMADIPFVKAFISRNPSQGMQPIQDFYDGYNKAQEIENTIKTMSKEGRQDEAAQYLEAHQGEAFKLQPIHQALGAQAALVKAINIDPRYSGDEKRQLIDTAYYQMWNMAKMGVKIMGESKKAIEARRQ